MTEEQAPTQQDHPPRPLNQETSDELKAFGFDPGIPVYEVDEIGFSLDDLKRALFESIYRAPVALPINIGERGFASPDVELHMVVESVQAFYPPYTPNLDMKQSLGCSNVPEWYVRGFLYKSGFDAYPETIRMHVYITTGDSADDFNYMIVQVARHPSGADPSTPLVWGKDIPGQSE
jgi:hypothetical protein